MILILKPENLSIKKSKLIDIRFYNFHLSYYFFFYRFATPFVAASRGFVDAIITPRNTREIICLDLINLENKELDNPTKKHDNIPL